MNTRLALLFPALLAGSGGAMAAPAQPEIIPLQSYMGKDVSLQAQVNGQTHTFLFDSGEGVSMISPSVAAQSGCHPWASVTGFRALGERIDAPRCDHISFAFPHEMRRPLATIVYDLSKFTGPGAPKLDGSIGLDTFADDVITISLARQQLIIETPESLAGRITHGFEIPLRIVRDAEGTALSVDVGVVTPSGLAWMELDTGNGGPTIFVSQAVAQALKLDATTRRPEDAPRQHVDLVLATESGAAGKGGFHFPTDARVFPNMIMDGNIGTQLLKAHDITLDLKSGRAWLSR